MKIILEKIYYIKNSIRIKIIKYVIKMVKTTHFITYGNEKFAQAKKRILKEAEEFGEFKTIKAYGPEDLNNEIKVKFKKILNISRGGGFWMWKPYIFKDMITKMNEGEYLVYMDAGSTINPLGKKRFFEYLDLLENSNYGVLSFQMTGNNGPGHYHEERLWTSKEIFRVLNIDIDSEPAISGQIMATVYVMKKNQHLVDFIDNYIEIFEANPLLITDYYCRISQRRGFLDSDLRWIGGHQEQGLSSVLRKKMGSVVIDGDESWMQPLGRGESLNYPFWATRSKT